MTNKYIFYTFILLCMLLLASARIGEAGEGPPANASEQWRNELKRLVMLSRLVAHNPSLLREKPSTAHVPKVSAEPFGCESSDVSECLLSQTALVLMQQATGSANIFDAAQGAAVQIHFMRATDVWSDKDIENNWDVVKKWTDAVGPVALIAGAILLYRNSSSNAGATLIGSGAGLILVGNIGTLGQLYGGVNAKQRAKIVRKTINTLQDIDASRQAYEDSQLMYGLFKSYSTTSEKLLRELATLSGEAKDLMRAAPSAAKVKRIVELCDKTKDTVSSFKEAAGFASEYANQLLHLYTECRDKATLPEEKIQYEEAQQRVKEFSDTYDAVIVPFLQGVPEEIEAMQNIKAASIANSIDDKQYF